MEQSLLLYIYQITSAALVETLHGSGDISMHFDLAWEFIKTAGSLGGLVSASFLIYDRYVRYRPILEMRSAGGTLILNVINPSPEHILITFICNPSSIPLFRTSDEISDSQKAISIVRGSPNKQKYICWKDSCTEFSIDNIKADDIENFPKIISIKMKWGFLQYRYIPRTSITYKITRNNLKKLLGASHA